MEGLARSIRLVTGLGMIAAGSSLAAPAGIELAAWWQATAKEIPGPPSAVAPSLPLAGRSDDSSGAVADAVQPPAGPADEVAGVWAANGPRPEIVYRDYVPPPPPPPLPAPPAGLVSRGPDLSAHYRTTLTAPPPPLLDGQRPPPLAVGWTARGGVPPEAFRRPPVAASYRVRDGDDLTAIAIRCYGAPAAAAAIWQANRGILRDPGLLPIGAVLTLPPPDAILAGPGQGQRQSIEPPAAPPAMPQPRGPATTASWLERD